MLVHSSTQVINLPYDYIYIQTEKYPLHTYCTHTVQYKYVFLESHHFDSLFCIYLLQPQGDRILQLFRKFICTVHVCRVCTLLCMCSSTYSIISLFSKGLVRMNIPPSLRPSIDFIIILTNTDLRQKKRDKRDKIVCVTTYNKPVQ